MSRIDLFYGLSIALLAFASIYEGPTLAAARWVANGWYGCVPSTSLAVIGWACSTPGTGSYCMLENSNGEDGTDSCRGSTPLSGQYCICTW